MANQLAHNVILHLNFYPHFPSKYYSPSVATMPHMTSWNRHSRRVHAWNTEGPAQQTMSQETVLVRITVEASADNIGILSSLSSTRSLCLFLRRDLSYHPLTYASLSLPHLCPSTTGVMTSIPWELFSDMCDPTKTLNKDGSSACAVAMIFLPK